MGQAFFKEYFDCSTEDPSGSSPIADRLEVIHAITLSSVSDLEFWNILYGGQRRPFEELDANWLFFLAFARHCKSLPSSNGTPRITV